MFSPRSLKSLRIFIFILLISLTSPLFAAPPSSAQIDQMLKVSRAQEIFVSMRAHTEATWRSALLAMAQQQHFSAQQQQQLDERMDRIIAAIWQETSWEKTKPLYKQAYARHCDSDDIQALIHWHLSPAGQALLNSTQSVLQTPKLMENPENLQRVTLLAEQGLSADELRAWREFQSSDSGMRIMQKSSQAMFEFMEASHQPIFSILQREIPELLGQQ